MIGEAAGRRNRRLGTSALGLGVALALLASGCGDDETTTTPAAACLPGGSGDPEELQFEIPYSCAYQCVSDCAEPETPYSCPAMGPWDQVPHADSCGCYTGKGPEVVAGRCAASDPSGEALRKAGDQGGQKWVLPDGHLIQPAGTYATLDEDSLDGTFPMTLLPIEGTSLMLSSDGGLIDNVFRLIDVDALAAGSPPTADYVTFARPTSLFHGIAWLPPDTALASGGGDGFVYAFTVDTAAATMSRDDTRDIDLGGPTSSSAAGARWYSGPIAVAGLGARLVVGPSTSATSIQVRSLEAGSWGQSMGTIAIDGQSVFEIAPDPDDPLGQTVYATVWDGDSVIELNIETLEVTHSLSVGKNPEGIAFLSPTAMVVAASDADTLTVIDRSSWTVHSQAMLTEEGQPVGHGPASLAFDAAASRLYAVLSGVDAVAVFDVLLDGNGATLTPAGRIPTAWWPTDVEVTADGSLVVLAGKGTGTGPDMGDYPYGDGPITELMHGGIQHVPTPSAATLGTMTEAAEEGRLLADTPGYPEVSCPDGDYDFPVPRTPAEGPSDIIEHVIFIVRENKTYDTVFGDLEGADGDPSLVLAPGDMPALFPNARKLAQGFTHFDNFYTDAEQSVQGHIWTVFGRTTDFIERAWLTAWGRGSRNPVAGLTEQGQPEEGGIFHALDRAAVPYANMGEIIGIGATSLDPRYPGLVTSIDKADNEKACYLAIRSRAMCDLPPFNYVVLPNDHTHGGSEGSPHPGVMIAVNDEATGMVVDALSHSPLWPKTLIIVTEDDPQNGADHVDVHRTILMMASPWVKRGYVSSGHYDMASVHKLILTILGVDYPNDEIAQAALPYDAFTSTPDYTPYDYEPRVYDQPCNPGGTRAAKHAEGWDFSEVDDQPGIAYWIWQILHHKSYD